MSPLLISLGAGVAIGLLYALLNVRSPAPPAIALVGLLGMIIGSQLSAQFTQVTTAGLHIKPAELSAGATTPSRLPLTAGRVG
uniref:DUF1427 family protein n=1 Tax=Pantoea sp. IMH TaxID=1267600 RepID=UPI00046AB123|nr:DUF1427 family protein [Pantoea sp. IMH]